MQELQYIAATTKQNMSNAPNNLSLLHFPLIRIYAVAIVTVTWQQFRWGNLDPKRGKK